MRANKCAIVQHTQPRPIPNTAPAYYEIDAHATLYIRAPLRAGQHEGCLSAPATGFLCRIRPVCQNIKNAVRGAFPSNSFDRVGSAAGPVGKEIGPLPNPGTGQPQQMDDQISTTKRPRVEELHSDGRGAQTPEKRASRP
jgi:hypothetical protein